MDFTTIPANRLNNHGLSDARFKSVESAVEWLGAVQSQEYSGGLWSIGMRIKGMNELETEKAIIEKKIVRTWPMRGTIHFVPAKDAKWMVNLLAPRINKKMEYYYKKSELDASMLNKCREITIANLSGGRILSRNTLYKLWEAAGISTKAMRGVFIVGNLAQAGLICFGPKEGKQPTFTLLDEWITESRELLGDEAIAELAWRYFQSHGPAEVKDFMWWTGLTMKESNAGINLVKEKLVEYRLEGKIYYAGQQRFETPKNAPRAYLLQPYDEYTVAYKDHSLVDDTQGHTRERKDIKFYSIVILDGRVVGFWKRTLKKDAVVFEFDFLRNLTDEDYEAVRLAAARYAEFLGLEVG